MGQRVVVQLGFIKKTQATPVADLRIARKRLKELLQHGHCSDPVQFKILKIAWIACGVCRRGAKSSSS